MSYKYRVTLAGLKGFARVYAIRPESTLYTFHKQMRADMEFPQDQLILFKAMDSEGGVVARYGLFDLGDGAADQISMAKTVKDGITSFVYFYDVTNKKSVIITFEGEIDEQVSTPKIIESKGPDPIEFENGYVAFEDLPEDKRRLPSDDKDEKKKKKASLADLLNIDPDEDLDDEDLDDEDDDDEDDEDEDEKDEEGSEIYDGSEELTL